MSISGICLGGWVRRRKLALVQACCRRELQPIQVAMDCRHRLVEQFPGSVAVKRLLTLQSNISTVRSGVLPGNVAKEILGSSPKLPTPVGSQPWLWRKYWKGDASPYLRLG